MSQTLRLVALLAVALSMALAQSSTAAALTEKRLLDCTLQSTSTSDCNPAGYAIRVGVYSAPGLIIAVFLLLACPFYCVSKYCCNCCGGRNQSPNFCCPADDLVPAYSTADILRPKILSLVLLCTTIGALIWGIVGAANVGGGLNQLGDAITGVPDIITTEINAIDAALTVQQYFASNDSVVTVSLLASSGADIKTEAEKVRTDVKKQVSDNLGSYRDIISKVQIALYAIFAVPAVIITFGFLAALVNVRSIIPMCLTWNLFLFGFVVWLVHVVFCLTSFTVGDLCAEIHGLANKQVNLVATLMQCKDSQFASFRTAFDNLETTQSTTVCNGLRALCYDNSQTAAQNVAAGTVFECPSTINCVGSTFASVLQLLNSAFKIHPSVSSFPNARNLGYTCFPVAMSTNCYVADCADNCVDQSTMKLSAVGRSSKEVYFNFKTAQTISNTLDTLGSRFSTCDNVMSIVATPFSPPCSRTTDGLVNDRRASGLMGLCAIAGIFIFAWGAKRFISLSEAGVPQTGGAEEKV